MESNSLNPPGATFRLEVKGTYDARYSSLAQWVSLWIPDRRQAEGYFILALASLLVGYVILNYVGWAFVEPYLLTDRSGTAPYLFFAIQSSLGLLFLSVSFWGVRPSLHVTLEDGVFQIKQGQKTVIFGDEDIQEMTRVDPMEVHRHYSRFAKTKIFTTDPTQTYLFIRLAQEVVLVGAGEQTSSLENQLVQLQKERVMQRPYPVS